jgi:hypothetical protein
MNKHTMTVSNSLIHGNSGGTLPTARDASLAAGLGTVSNVGGGVANFGGVLLIQNSTIRDNTNVAGGGGGIAHLPEGALTIVDSTIAGNVVNGPGGGILFQGTFTLTNSTVSGNVADTGAGIAEINYNATAVIQYSTIASNTASLAGDSIALSHADSIVALTSSIVASAGDSCDLPTGATIIDQGYNLESSSSCGLTMTTSLANTNPLLLPLAANGGDTETHALAESSPALNTIPLGANGCGTLFVTDQRGDLRPSHGRCDMGSFEAQTNVYLPIILNQD